MIKHPNTLDRGILTGFVKPELRHLIALFVNKDYRRYHQVCTALSMSSSSRKVVPWGGHQICYSDPASLISNLGEIFVDKVYDFGNTREVPTIIDCGANIGLADLYWKLRYGPFEGFCFEPDPKLAAILKENFKNWGISARIIIAALSDSDGWGEFVSDESDAGYLTKNGNESSQKVKICRLSSFINKPVDLLKLDIEGAELSVLSEIRSKLGFVKRIFVECHCYSGSLQPMAEIINILESAGFSLAFRSGVPAKSLWITKEKVEADGMQTLNIYGMQNRDGNSG